MSQVKFDGVIEAVRYTSDGQIAFVRAYERRGPTFSDRLLLDRQTLVARLKSGQRFVTGQRKERWASTFAVGKTVKVVGWNGKVIVTTSAEASKRDHLEGVPVL